MYTCAHDCYMHICGLQDKRSERKLCCIHSPTPTVDYKHLTMMGVYCKSKVNVTIMHTSWQWYFVCFPTHCVSTYISVVDLLLME